MDSTPEYVPLFVVPLTLRDANAFVAEHHRHSAPAVGCKFAIGVRSDGGRLVGVAIAGRPVARMLDDGLTCEVLRVATDGSPNACSILYGACRRAARAMGYKVVITYTLASESGASLAASGARQVAVVKGRQCDRPSRRRKMRAETPDRIRWDL